MGPNVKFYARARPEALAYIRVVRPVESYSNAVSIGVRKRAMTDRVQIVCYYPRPAKRVRVKRRSWTIDRAQIALTR